MVDHDSQNREETQYPSGDRVPEFGHQPTNGQPYSSKMPKIGKDDDPRNLFYPDDDDPVAIAKANLTECFEFAKRSPGLQDRANANLLAQHLASHKAHYGGTVSKSHIYRIAKGEGPVATDVLHIIAKAYGLQAWQMLVPGMEPAIPPARIVDDLQRAMYNAIEQPMRQLRNKPKGDTQ